jgi:hypothetical protein
MFVGFLNFQMIIPTFAMERPVMWRERASALYAVLPWVESMQVWAALRCHLDLFDCFVEVIKADKTAENAQLEFDFGSKSSTFLSSLHEHLLGCKMQIWLCSGCCNHPTICFSALLMLSSHARM